MMWARRALALLLVAATPFVALPAQTQVVIVSGLGGEAVYSTRFAALSARLSAAMHERFGIPDADISWYGEDSTNVSPRFRGRSTKVNVERALRAAAGRAAPGSQLVVILIGHGAGEGPDTRISIPGPDLSAADLAKDLAAFDTQRIAVLDLTSASGDAIAALSAPNRVVITATKSAFERNESRFAEFFTDALANDGADTDKDGRISLLEAFRYAAAETKRLYESEGKLLTEHAQLDDDGDKQGTGEPTGRSGDGMLARRFFLDAGVIAARAASDPRLTAFYTERFRLEEQVDALKRLKPTMDTSAYAVEIERALIALARKSREIRVLEGKP